MHEFLDLFEPIPAAGPTQFPLGLWGGCGLGRDYLAAHVGPDHAVSIRNTPDEDGLDLLAVEPVAYEGASALAVQRQVAGDAARLLVTLAHRRDLIVFDGENRREGVVTARLASLLNSFVKRDTKGPHVITDVFLSEDAAIQAGVLRRLRDARIHPIDRESWANLRTMTYGGSGAVPAARCTDFLLAVNETYRRALVRPILAEGPARVYHDDGTGTWRHTCGLAALDSRPVLIANF